MSRYHNSNTHQRTLPRPVNLLHGDDFKCAVLGSLGFSTRLIMRHTGLTPSQIGYRLRKGEIRAPTTATVILPWRKISCSAPGPSLFQPSNSICAA